MGFTIAKTYASYVELAADELAGPTGINAGQFAIISTLNSNDPDDSKLFLWD